MIKNGGKIASKQRAIVYNRLHTSLCRVAVVSGRSPSCTVARRGKAIIKVIAQALSAARGKLKVDRIADKSELNQFWIWHLLFGIEDSMLEVGAAVDFRFLICGAS